MDTIIKALNNLAAENGVNGVFIVNSTVVDSPIAKAYKTFTYKLWFKSKKMKKIACEYSETINTTNRLETAVKNEVEIKFTKEILNLLYCGELIDYYNEE